MFLPWYNQPQIDFLNQHKAILSNFNVFEYGSGFSTLYYSGFANSVTSVEARPEWFDKIANHLNEQFANNTPQKSDTLYKINNTSLFLVKSGFAESINVVFLPKLDLSKTCNVLIVVDSNDRAKCLAISTQIAKMQNINAIILLDNSERPNLQTAIKQTIDLSFYYKTFTGVRPNDGLISTSTMFCLRDIF